jgi:hypothetical protein
MTYYGWATRRRLPADLDVFIATYSQASALAYALAKLSKRRAPHRRGGHARSFPRDRRFFDVSSSTATRG